MPTDSQPKLPAPGSRGQEESTDAALAAASDEKDSGHASDKTLGEESDPAFDGDPTWHVTRCLRDGSKVIVRPITPEDRDELRRGFVELSPESRYFRFLQLGTAPTEELLAYLTNVDQRDHVALGAVLVSADLKTERGIGIARFVRLDGLPDTAEAAVTVADDMQRRGVGTVLLRELLRAARLRGIRTLRADVLAENETMRTILEQNGARKVLAESGAGTIAYDIEIDDAPASSPSFFDILKGAAQTMAMRLRR